MGPMTNDELRRLAREGARLQLTTILAEFPDLLSEMNQRAARQAQRDDDFAASRKNGQPRRRRMSAAARKAISVRMTAHWAKRRAKKGASR